MTEWTKEDYIAAAKLEGWVERAKDPGFLNGPCGIRMIEAKALRHYGIDPSKHFTKETFEEAMIRRGWFKGDNKKVGDRAGVYERRTSFGEQARMDFPPGATFWADWWYKESRNPELPKPRRKRKEVELEEGRLYWCMDHESQPPHFREWDGSYLIIPEVRKYGRKPHEWLEIYEIENGRKGRRVR